ncbi:vacuolar protein sorting-associated protein 13c [Anaeramoeba flamelloides]|uniref:Vacuolar protein sorting-associated protein 13c n=1 Tax=Anaeramoeba flamelloides TaxID=1746091 RepID=A0ABQ8YQJ8_9EUKA|nr:vacuolar protein sorting-associated protein 13c [Anaeramoeba flamelloides]
MKTLVSFYLNRILGRFLKPVHQDQLQLGLWEGDVSINNIQLHEETFEILNLPLKLKWGQINNLELEIPWKNLSSQPVNVDIDGIYLIAQPIFDEHIEKSLLIKRENNKKQEKLRIREAWVDDQKRIKNNNEKSGSWFSVLQNNYFFKKILDNLQVSISNIHIRIECNINNRNDAIGITLDSLEIKSTNSKWETNFINNSPLFWNKLIKFNCFSIYWDLNSNPIYSNNQKDYSKRLLSMIKSKKAITKNEVKKKPKTTIKRNIKTKIKVKKEKLHGQNKHNKEHFYIFSPFSGEIKIKVKRRTFRSGDSLEIPQLTLESNLKEITLSITREHYKGIRILTSDLKNYYKEKKYLKYDKPRNRPTKEGIQTNKKWWIFGYTCIKKKLKKEKGLLDWETLVILRLQRDKYISLYKDKLAMIEDNANEWDNSITQRHLIKLENKIPYKYIVLFRSIAEQEYEEEQKKKKTLLIEKEKEKQKKGWLAQLLSNDKYDQNLNIQVHFTDEIISKILNEHFQTNEEEFTENEITIDTSPKNYHQFKANLKLKVIRLILKDSTDDYKTVTELISEKYETNFQLTKISHHFQIKLKSLQLIDYSQSNSKYPILIKQRKPNHPDSNNSYNIVKNTTENELLILNYDHEYDNSNNDIKLKIILKSLDIIYNSNYIRLIKNFFIIKSNFFDLSLIEKHEKELQKELIFEKIQNTFLIKKLILEHKLINLDLNIDAPIIIIPIDYTKLNSTILIFDLGKLKMVSDLNQNYKLKKFQNKYNINQNNNTNNNLIKKKDFVLNEKYLYDYFIIELTDIRSLIFSNYNEWSNYINNNKLNHSNQILKEFNTNIKINFSIIPSHPNYYSVKVFINLNKLHFELNLEQYIELLLFIDYILIPNNDNDDNNSFQKDHIIIDKDNLNNEYNKKSIEYIQRINQNLNQKMIKNKLSNFEINLKKITIKILKSKQLTNSKLLKLNIFDSKINFLKSNYNNLLKIKIKSFLMYNYFFDKKQLLINNSLTNNNTINNFLIFNCDISQIYSPEFKGVEKVIDLNLNELIITLNGKTFSEIKKILFHYKKKKKQLLNLKINRRGNYTKEKNQNNEKFKLKKFIKIKKKPRKVMKKEIIKYFMNLKINKFKFIFSKKFQKQLFGMNISNLNWNIKNNIKWSEITGSFQDFEITNLTKSEKERIYPYFIKLNKKKIFNFSFDLYHDKKWKLYPRYDSKLSLQLNGLQIYYLQQFVDEFNNYFDFLSYKNKRYSTSATTIKQRTTHFIGRHIQEQIKSLFKIELLNIQIILPQNSCSKNILISKIDKIILTNKFLILRENNNQILTDNYQFNLTNFHLKIGRFNGLHTNSNTINFKDFPTVIRPIDLFINLQRPLNPQENRIPELFFSSSIPSIRIIFNKFQYYQFLKIFYQNFNEKSYFSQQFEKKYYNIINNKNNSFEKENYNIHKNKKLTLKKNPIY